MTDRGYPTLRMTLRIEALHNGDNAPIVVEIPAPKELTGHKQHILSEGVKLGYSYPLSGRELNDYGHPLPIIRRILRQMLRDVTVKAEEAITERYTDPETEEL